DFHEADDEQRQHHHAAGGDQHQKRYEPMLEEAALLLDAPRFVHGAGHRTEHTERPPYQGEQAADTQLHARTAKGVELAGDEVELRRKVAKDEVEDRAAI